jgi:hypothetical protein
MKTYNIKLNGKTAARNITKVSAKKKYLKDRSDKDIVYIGDEKHIFNLLNDLKKVFDSDLYYAPGIHVEYDSGRDNEEHEYCSDSICRCGTIENAHVDEVNFGELSKYLKEKIIKLGYKISEIKEYCIDRVFAINRDKIIDGNNYSVGVCCGYYGQEIDGVSVYLGFMAEELYKVMSVDDLFAVREILLMEYGHLIFDIKTVKVVEIEYKKLKIGNIDYPKKLNRQRIEEYRGSGGIIGIYRGKRLIDGYHRYFANEGAKVVKILEIA